MPTALTTKRRQGQQESVVPFKRKPPEISQVDLEEYILLDHLYADAREAVEKALSGSLLVHGSGEYRLDCPELPALTKNLIEAKAALDEVRQQIVEALQAGATIEDGVHSARIETKLVVG